MNKEEFQTPYKRYFKESDLKYFYIAISNKTQPFGMTSSGSFTSDKSRWMLFTQEEKDRFEGHNKKPYGASRSGVFMQTTKFM